MATSTAPPAMITHKPNLKLELATPEDLPAICSVWYECFPSPMIMKMFPNTPSVHKWWNDANGHGMVNNPAAKYLVVKDYSNEGDKKVVGYAKWWIPIGEQRLKPEERFPAWPEEGDHDLSNRFFGNLGKERKEFMGDRQYYYLDMLGTSPSYRRLGIANMLVGWGVTLADQDKLECFVDASDEGKPVYEKFGFVGQEPFLIPGETFTCTSYIRPARS